MRELSILEASQNHKYLQWPPRTSSRTRDTRVQDSAARTPKRPWYRFGIARTASAEDSSVPASHPLPRGFHAPARSARLGPALASQVTYRTEVRALRGKALLLTGQTARDTKRQLRVPGVRRWLPRELFRADCVCRLYGTRRGQVLLCALGLGGSTRAIQRRSEV